MLAKPSMVMPVLAFLRQDVEKVRIAVVGRARVGESGSLMMAACSGRIDGKPGKEEGRLEGNQKAMITLGKESWWSIP